MGSLRQVRRLRIEEERHPNENEVWEAWDYSKENHCIVELEWMVPHIGWKKWVIRPEDNIQELLENLHII